LFFFLYSYNLPSQNIKKTLKANFFLKSEWKKEKKKKKKKTFVPNKVKTKKKTNKKKINV
jgi:hypothetical protein